MAYRAIIIPNIYEYNRAGMSPDTSEKVLNRWRGVGGALGDLALFWTAYEKLILSPRPIDQAFVGFVERNLGFQQITIRSPKQIHSEAVEDLTADQDLLEEVVTFAQTSNSVMLMAWGATVGLYSFLERLGSRGLSIQTRDIPPREYLWSAMYLDSKAGFRHLCAGLAAVDPRILIPEGFIVHSLPDILEFVRYFFRRGRGCILKANRGVSGAGLIPLELEWSKHTDELLYTYIKSRAEELAFLMSQGPIVVEELVRSRQTAVDAFTVVGSIFLNGFIEPDGQVTIVGGGCELRNRQNYYVGAQMGKGSALEVVAPLIEPIMLKVCEMAARYGYRGHIGADFLINDEGRPVILELNARRSSESPLYDLAHHLFGPDWRSTHSVLLRLPLYVALKQKLEIAAVVEVFDLVNGQAGKDSIVAVPMCLSWLHATAPALGYAIFGSGQDEVIQAEKMLLDRLALLGIYTR